MRQNKNRGQLNSMSICATALFISLLIFLLTCFSAVTYYSAEQKLVQAQAAESRSRNTSQRNRPRRRSSNPFIRSGEKPPPTSTDALFTNPIKATSKLQKIDNVIYFSVPAGGGNILNVEAKVSKKQVVIQRWQLEKE